MSNKRLYFIGWSYVITAIVMNAKGVTGSAYLIALIAIFIVSGFVYPENDKGKEDEKTFSRRDPME
jgi:hypothetical protein